MKMVQVCSSIRQEDVMCPRCVQQDIDRALLKVKLQFSNATDNQKGR